jgi:hypothetical protein
MQIGIMYAMYMSMKTKQQTKLEKIIAEELGKQAFLDGKKCVPAFDEKLMELLKGNEIGEGIPALKSWLKGWHKQNLSN